MKIISLQINSLKEAGIFMKGIGADAEGIKIMAPKVILKAFKIEEISSYSANIIKQQLLSLGADAAISRKALVKKVNTDIIIFGTLSQLRKFTGRIKHQPFGLKDLSFELNSILEQDNKTFRFRARDKVLIINKPLICGVINLTPDSFSGDGIFKKKADSKQQLVSLVLNRVSEMLKYGVKIIDIGGESTRPYSGPVKEDEEIKRVIPYLKLIRKKFPRIILSIDTYKYKVTKQAINEGVDIVNDITALRYSPKIASLIKKYRLGCVLMHMKRTPQTMQVKPVYKHVRREILGFLSKQVKFCLNEGIKKEQIMIDPGIGFGKRLEDNLEIINHLDEFKSLGLPIFLGISRKSFIGDILKAGVEERLIGTVAGVVLSVLRGVDILRVHDVKEVSQAIRIVNKILNH